MSEVTCQHNAVVILIVVIDWDRGHSLGSKRGHDAPRAVRFAARRQLDSHVNGLLQHRVHPDDPLRERLIPQDRPAFVFLPSLQEYLESESKLRRCFETIR